MNGLTLTPTRGHLRGGLPLLTALAAGKDVPEGMSDWVSYLNPAIDTTAISETWRNCPLVGYIDFSYSYVIDDGVTYYEVNGQSTRAGFIQLDDSELGFTEVGEAEFDLSLEHSLWWPVMPATLVTFTGEINGDPFEGSDWIYQTPNYYIDNFGNYDDDRVWTSRHHVSGSALWDIGNIRVLHDSTVVTDIHPVGDGVTVSEVTINRVDWITTF